MMAAALEPINGSKICSSLRRRSGFTFTCDTKIKMFLLPGSKRISSGFSSVIIALQLFDSFKRVVLFAVV